MAGPQYQILCHAVGALSILLACIFIVTGICLQVFDPQDDSDNLLPWRTDCIILTVIGVFALIVFIIYFCHVARRNWKVFNVINIRPHYKRKNPAMDEGWHSADKQGHTSADTEGIDGITPAQAYSREFSLEETESSVSDPSPKQLVKVKQGKYKPPRQVSDISDDSDNMEIVPVQKHWKETRRQRSSKKKTNDSPKSSFKDYVIRSSQRYSVNEPKRDQRVEAKAKADRKLMESLGKKDVNSDKYGIAPAIKSFRKNVDVDGGIPSQKLQSEKSGIDNEAYLIQPRKPIVKQTIPRDSKKYPDGILKKSSTDRSEMIHSNDQYVIQSKRQRKFQKRAHSAVRHSSQKINVHGVDENSLDKPSWVVTAKSK